MSWIINVIIVGGIIFFGSLLVALLYIAGALIFERVYTKEEEWLQKRYPNTRETDNFVHRYDANRKEITVEWIQ